MAVLKGMVKARLEPDMAHTKKALQDFLNNAFLYNSASVVQDIEFFRKNAKTHKPRIKIPQEHNALAVIAVVVDVLDVKDDYKFIMDIASSIEKSATQDKVYLITAELKRDSKGFFVYCYFSYDPLDFTIKASK